VELKLAGATTFAQNKTSSVVYGMPREAVNLGAAGIVGNLNQIREKLDRIIALSIGRGRAA